jgi:MFS family permease
MESIVQKIKKNGIFNIFYLSNFLLYFHIFLLAYINSSFLSSLIAERFVGIIYVIGSLLSIGTLFYISRILKWLGNYRALIILTIVEIFSLVALALFQNTYALVTIFIAHLVIFPLMLFNIDIFVESSLKTEEHTGGIRGTLLTIANIAVVLSPLVAGIILTNGDFWKMYLISAGLLVPFLFIALYKFNGFIDPIYHKFKIIGAFKVLKNNKNIFGIFTAAFLMRFFFSFMVVYMPIYLHNYIGFEWSQIGIIFAVMLIPYILFEIPAGKIADKWYGEKEMMFAGFFILALFTVSLSFITLASAVLWTAMLFMTRVGASLVEVTTESYFFKHVRGDDADTISLFRMARPGAYVIGPIVATIALLFIDMQYLFLLLGIILFSALYFTSVIRDTK